MTVAAGCAVCWIVEPVAAVGCVELGESIAIVGCDEIGELFAAALALAAAPALAALGFGFSVCLGHMSDGMTKTTELQLSLPRPR